MLHNKKVIHLVSQALQHTKIPFVVLDPVIVSKSGCPLLSPHLIDYLKHNLFSLVTLVTPNLPEAEALLDHKIQTDTEMANAAEKLGKTFNINVLIKGGHLNSSTCSDVLYLKDYSKIKWLHAERILTKNTHGTGCTLSSAIASYLAHGHELYDAISQAKRYLTHAILSGKDLSIGQGIGPVNHFYFLSKGDNHERCRIT